MTPPLHELQDDRVRLRGWREDDLPAWAALNADREVMAHFPAPLSRDESDAMAGRVRQRMEAQGYGWWALQTPELAFAGAVGLMIPVFELPAPLLASLWPVGTDAALGPLPAGRARRPALHEIGWRLSRAAWGRGDATRAAALALGFARDVLDLPGVVSFTALANDRSQAVMRRLGMERTAEFDHPRLPAGHPLQRHVLFAIRWA